MTAPLARDTLAQLSAAVAAWTPAGKAARGEFLGRAITVPPGELHVVTGDGRMSLLRRKGTTPYPAGESYYLNNLTRVIRLSLHPITLPLHPTSGRGLFLTDRENARFYLWAELTLALADPLTAARQIDAEGERRVRALLEALIDAVRSAVTAQSVMATSRDDPAGLSPILETAVANTLEKLGYRLQAWRLLATQGLVAPARDRSLPPAATPDELAAQLTAAATAQVIAQVAALQTAHEQAMAEAVAAVEAALARSEQEQAAIELLVARLRLLALLRYPLRGVLRAPLMLATRPGRGDDTR